MDSGLGTLRKDMDSGFDTLRKEIHHSSSMLRKDLTIWLGSLQIIGMGLLFAALRLT